MPELDRNKTMWGSYDGRETLVKDLDVRHLVNILNHIKQMNEDPNQTSYSPELYAFLKREAELRVMLGFAENKGIPRKHQDGTYTLINQTAAEKVIEDAKSLMHKQLMERQIRENKAKKAKKGRPSELEPL